MDTILVTGDTGFIGEALVGKLVTEGYRVIGVSRKKESDVAFSHPAYRHISSNVGELLAEAVGEPIDTLVDLAWAGSMGPARGDNELQRNNITNAVLSLELGAQLGVKLYLGAGTITELTSHSLGAIQSDAVTYGTAKHLARLETKKRAQELEVKHIWLRLGNTYSENDSSGRFLNSTLSKLLQGEEISLMTGNQPFDFIHLSDAVNAISTVIKNGEASEIYYIGNGEVKTIEDFVAVASKVIGSHSQVASTHVENLSLSEADLSNDPLRALGYRQLVSFEAGVKLWKNANLKG